MRTLACLLCSLLLGCAAGQPAARSVRVAGLVTLDGTEQPLEGVSVTVRPFEAIARRPEAAPADLAAEARTNADGAFAIDALDEASPLPRGWSFEVQAVADGFLASTAVVAPDGLVAFAELSLSPIDDEEMQGLQLSEMPADAVDNPRGTLIKEVLRRQGRLPVAEP